MKLTGEPKEKVGQTKTKEEAKQEIEKVDIELTNEETEQVSGGRGNLSDPDYRQAVRTVSQMHQQMRSASSKAQADEILRKMLFESYKGYSYKDIAIERGFL